jgi:hypothetical protein
MRTVTLAVGSFIVGAVCMSLFGNHISTFRQSDLAFAQTASPRVNRWVPIVPPVTVANELGGSMIAGQTIDLDGFIVYDNIFRNVTIRYGGGAYLLRNSTFEGETNLQFIGAAGNTFALLNSLGMIGCAAAPKTPPATNPNTPVIHSATLKTAIKGTFVSPYSGK